MSILLPNASYVFYNSPNFYDINTIYFLIGIAVVFTICSRINFDMNKTPKLLFAILAFGSILTSLFMVGSAVSFSPVAQFITNQSSWNGAGNITISQVYNGSSLQVFPENSFFLGLFCIIFAVIIILNIVELIYSILEEKKNPLKVKSDVKTL